MSNWTAAEIQEMVASPLSLKLSSLSACCCNSMVLTGRYFQIKGPPAKNPVGTQWPNHWTSAAFGETRTRLETNIFGVVSCVGSFRSRADVVGSDWACEVWGGGPSDVWAIGFSDWLCASWMAVLIAGVLVNQRGVWEGRNTVCTLFFYALCSIIPPRCSPQKH